MAKVNVKATLDSTDIPRTHEGGIARRITPEFELRRSVMSCLLWENEFYESGVTISDRIKSLIPKVRAEIVGQIAIEARTKMKLRHVPLLIVREMARLETHKHLVSEILSMVIQRADELSEFLAIYWKDGRQKLSGQVKKGLAKAFPKFSAYDLAKYNRDETVKLRDVLFLSHAKPKDKEQEEVWKKLIAGTLEPPDTWEVALSAAGKDKKEIWERLLAEKKLGALALLRNLRNMKQANVDKTIILNALESIKVERVLPFRFISAARYAPQWEPQLEEAMMKCLSAQEKLPGKTILIIDVSGSMNSALSSKSELTRIDAACALSILVREVCESVSIYATAGNDHTRIHATALVPARHGVALRDTIYNQASKLKGGGIFLTQCLNYIQPLEKTADRMIVFTDEQDCDLKLAPSNAKTFCKENYLVNIASYKNGIGYGKWIHIDGFSEAIINFIIELEKTLAVSDHEG